MSAKKAETNRSNPDQTASEEAVWLVSSLFAILTSYLWIPAMINYVLFENRNKKVFESLEHAPYMFLLKLQIKWVMSWDNDALSPITSLQV